MSDPNAISTTSVSGSRNLEEISDFWDTHSLDDYWDQTQVATFEVRARQRRRVTLDPDLYTRVAAQAQERGISPETLVNLWLVERLADTPSTSA